MVVRVQFDFCASFSDVASGAVAKVERFPFFFGRVVSVDGKVA